MRFTWLTLANFLGELAVVNGITFLTSYALAQGKSETMSYLLLTILNSLGMVGRWVPGVIADYLGRFNTLIVTTTMAFITILPSGFHLATALLDLLFCYAPRFLQWRYSFTRTCLLWSNLPYPRLRQALRDYVCLHILWRASWCSTFWCSYQGSRLYRTYSIYRVSLRWNHYCLDFVSVLSRWFPLVCLVITIFKARVLSVMGNLYTI